MLVGQRALGRCDGVLAFENPQKGFIRTASEERGSESWVHLQITTAPQAGS